MNQAILNIGVRQHLSGPKVNRFGKVISLSIHGKGYAYRSSSGSECGAHYLSCSGGSFKTFDKSESESSHNKMNVSICGV